MNALRQIAIGSFQLAICNAVLFALGPITAQSSAAEDELAPSAVNEPAAPPNVTSPIENPDEREKRRKVLAGIAAVVGILIIGVALGTLVILWAGRLRRINRKPLPRTCVKNEYWYLQPPKPPVSDTGPDEAQG